MVARFKLESVLKHRRHLEDDAQRAFSATNRKWDEARRVLDGMRRNRGQYEQDLKNHMLNNAAAGELVLYHRYLGRLDMEIEDQQMLVNELEAKREKKRGLLLTALKNRKMIEKLKEGFIQKHARRRQIQEQQLMNEAAISRYKGNPEASD